MSDTRRLFVAVMADDALQVQLASYQSRWHWPRGATLVPAANFHLTLRFLGAADVRAESRLQDWLRLVPLDSFELQLARPGSFSGGVAWLGPVSSDRLEALHERVNAAATWAGFPLLGEAWTPHVTLARNCTGAVPPSAPVRLLWTVRSFALVSSAQGRYTVLASWPAAKHA